jgi:ABC-type antimicrobial peptide transport system permease subunit
LDPAQSSLALGLVLGIVFIWFGIILMLVSRPLARGEVHSRGYNYRPWQPKFVKKLTDDEADAVNKIFAKWAIACGGLMVLVGIAAMALGIQGQGQYIYLVISLPIVALIALIIIAYAYVYRFVKNKAGLGEAKR